MRSTNAATALTTALLLLTMLASARAETKPDVEREMKQDVVLRALVDELDRGKVGLKLEDLQRPYFVEYALRDAVGASVFASLGAVTRRNEGRSRTLRTDVRVGSYELDNTNFSGGGYGSFYFGGMFGGRGGADIPIEDDYNALRQAIWWATDRDYKNVIESFEKKKAFMQGKMIEDKPDDFSREETSVYFEERIDPKIDVDELEKIAVSLSAVFREFADVQTSGVTITGAEGNKYLVNSEGTRIRISASRFSLSVAATVQADDGMKLSDSITIYALSLDELPSLAELRKQVREMTEQLIAIKNAPILESYTGPVLFHAKPAASMFAIRFGRQFAGGQRPVGSSTRPDDFENMIGKRILPRFMTVIDDPTLETFNDQPVLGHYDYDDQGVRSRAITLVEKGKLKALLMSRNPSKQFTKSTGHGRGVFGPSASVGCLMVSSNDPVDAEGLKEQLIEAFEDEDLEFGIRIASLGSTGGGGGGGYPGYRGGGGGSNPLVMYKVFSDGHEELVRGAEIARVGLKVFKRMLAAGDEPHLRNSAGRAAGRTVIAPAMLLEELDLAKIDRDFDKPPILPTPLAR